MNREQPDRSSSTYRRVLVPTDLRPESERAFAVALTVALRAHSTLTLAHVVPSADSRPAWSARPTVRAMLERWGVLPEGATVDAYEALGIRVEMLALVGDDPAARIVEQGLSGVSDLLVLATHGRTGLDRLVGGSVAEEIARLDSVTPALFVGDGVSALVDVATGVVRVSRVLVPLAPGDDQQAAVDEAVRLLDALGVRSAQLILLHVGDASMPDVRMPDRPNLSFVTDRRSGGVVDAILDAARDHDVNLLVMATHGRNDPVDLLRGSRTERVVRGSPCPVLAVPVFP